MSKDTPSGHPEAPKIEFPCAYPLKIVGNAADDFHVFVAEILEKHTGESFHERIEIVHSSKGRFVSARVTITATGIEQLQAIFEDFKASGRIHTVL